MTNWKTNESFYFYNNYNLNDSFIIIEANNIMQWSKSF